MHATTLKSIRELREEQRLTIQDVCRLAGITDGELRGWEAGRREIQSSKIPALAKAFGVTIDHLRLEPHRFHYTSCGFDLVLRSNGNPEKGYTAYVDVLVRRDGRVQHTINQYAYLKATAPTEAASLTALAGKLDEVFAQQQLTRNEDEVASHSSR